MPAEQSPVGRLAPSPTGAQHVGNARTFLIAWLSSRQAAGQVLLRIEDIDSPRVKPGASQQAIDDLRWLGLDWDEGPDIGGASGPYVQTQRGELYREALRRLQELELVYPCTCSRSDVAAAASAPHAGAEGPIYPGTCRWRTTADADSLPAGSFAWRVRANDEWFGWHDRLYGPLGGRVASQMGDFVVARHDGAPAYQLAVVVDDHAMGITEVVRGADLISSTTRQLMLYSMLGWRPPVFGHVPMVVGPDGRRLAKRHGDTRLSTLRDAGGSPEALIGLLAWSCGLLDRVEPVATSALVHDFRWDRITRLEPFVFDPAS